MNTNPFIEVAAGLLRYTSLLHQQTSADRVVLCPRHVVLFVQLTVVNRNVGRKNRKDESEKEGRKEMSYLMNYISFQESEKKIYI